MFGPFNEELKCMCEIITKITKNINITKFWQDLTLIYDLKTFYDIYYNLYLFWNTWSPFPKKISIKRSIFEEISSFYSSFWEPSKPTLEIKIHLYIYWMLKLMQWKCEIYGPTCKFSSLGLYLRRLHLGKIMHHWE